MALFLSLLHFSTSMSVHIVTTENGSCLLPEIFSSNLTDQIVETFLASFLGH